MRCCWVPGMGVTGGTPLGFDVGAQGAGGTLPGLDLVCAQFVISQGVAAPHQRGAASFHEVIGRNANPWAVTCCHGLLPRTGHECCGCACACEQGVRGMRVGGQRKLIVPPELAYGRRGVGEIPPDATLEFEVQLLSIKSSPFGYRTKLVEG